MQALARIGALEAVCSDSVEREAVRYHARWAYSDPAVLLKEAEPQGVVVERRTVEERPVLIRQCLSAAASVLVVGVPGSAANCKRLDSLAKVSGRFVLAAPAIRYAPVTLLARRLLDSGKFGRPISMIVKSSRRGSAQPLGRAGDAVPTDQVFEAVDLVHHLLGFLKRVFAVSHPEGALSVTGAADPGIPVGLVLHGSGPAEIAGIRLELRAADGTLLEIDQNCRLICRSGPRVEAAHETAMAAVDPALELGYEGLVADFRRLLESPKTKVGLLGPVCPGVAAAEAILASARKGRIVEPRYDESESAMLNRGRLTSASEIGAG
jgi:hypothetical protein